MQKTNKAQLGLFEKPTIDDAVSDAQDNETTAPQTDLNKKDRKNPYNVKKSYFTRLNYNTLRTIDYGLRQFKRMQEVFEALNPTEIFPLAYTIQKAKEKSPDGIKISENAAFEDIISQYVSNGLNVKQLASRHNRAKKIYPAKPGNLKARMGALSEETKKEFLDSLRKPRKYSDEERYPGNDFHDPNWPDGNSRMAYVNNIIGILKR